MTNTEYLMKALGWQGGTVHQVASATGLSVMQILDLHTVDYCAHNTPRRRGAWESSQGRLSGKPEDLEGIMLISYWFGVLQYQRGFY